jgi:hypothetical protein
MMKQEYTQALLNDVINAPLPEVITSTYSPTSGSMMKEGSHTVSYQDSQQMVAQLSSQEADGEQCVMQYIDNPLIA